MSEPSLVEAVVEIQDLAAEEEVIPFVDDNPEDLS